MQRNPSVWAMLTDLAANKVFVTTGSGAPTDGTTGAGVAGPGSFYIDYTNSLVYLNINTLASPTWKIVPVGSGTAAPYSRFSFPQVAHAKYDFAVDGGAVGEIVPASNTTIPANAVVYGGFINSTTAVTSAGSATVEVGTHAGSSATSILGSTAKTSLTLDAVIASAAASTPFKMSAAGAINLTVGTAALTAGVIEVAVVFVVTQNS